MLLAGCLNLSRAQITIHCYFSHEGINGTASWNLNRINKDYKALGVQVLELKLPLFPFFRLEEQVQPGVTWKSRRVMGIKDLLGRSWLEKRVTFFIMRRISHWNNLAVEMLYYPTLDTYKIQQDSVLGHLVLTVSREVGPDDHCGLLQPGNLCDSMK